MLDSHKERQLQESLAYQGVLDSRINIVSETNYDKEISEENKLIVEIIIAPDSRGVFTFEKYEDLSGINFNSELVFLYPLAQF